MLEKFFGLGKVRFEAKCIRFYKEVTGSDGQLVAHVPLQDIDVICPSDYDKVEVSYHVKYGRFIKTNLTIHVMYPKRYANTIKVNCVRYWDEPDSMLTYVENLQVSSTLLERLDLTSRQLSGFLAELYVELDTDHYWMTVRPNIVPSIENSF